MRKLLILLAICLITTNTWAGYVYNPFTGKQDRYPTSGDNITVNKLSVGGNGTNEFGASNFTGNVDVDGNVTADYFLGNGSLLTGLSGSTNDTAYNATTWDGITTQSPSMNSVRDKIESLAGGHDAVTVSNTDTVNLTLSTQALTADINGTWAATKQAADDDLTDLADGSLTASKVAGVADADYGDVVVSSGAWGVEDDSHNHGASTISGLGTADISGLSLFDDIASFPADPNADRLLMWDDDPGAFVFLDYSGWDVTAYTGGDHLTLTGHDFDVDDDFLLNNGDTGTGVYDFGGADSFELPNAADPTTDAAGEVGVRTGAGAAGGLELYDSTVSKLLPSYYSKSCFVYNLTDGDDIPLWKAPSAVTIRAIHAVSTLGNANVTLGEYDANGANGAVVDSAWIATSTTNANDDGTLSNPSIDSGDWVGLIVNNATANSTLAISWEYTYD